MKRTMLIILILALLAIINPVPIAVGQGQPKVDVCHITGEYDFGFGPQPIGHVITIAAPAVQAHVDHGDSIYWEMVALDDGSEVCTIACPCYSAQKLQTYYESVIDEFEAWNTRADDWPCPTYHYTEAIGFVSGQFLPAYSMRASRSGNPTEYMCSFFTYPPYFYESEVGLTQHEWGACRATIIQSQLFQNADNTDVTCH